MPYLPSIIPAGQVSLRGYQENNIFRHAQGIESYHQLVNYNFLEANRGVIWELPIDLELMSIFVFSSFFCMPKMSLKNKIALVFISSGLISAIALGLVLPEEKLILALSSPSALIGAGLAQCSVNKEEE